MLLTNTLVPAVLALLRSADQCRPIALHSQFGLAASHADRQSLAAMGQGHRCSSVARSLSSGRLPASPRLASHATGYQSSQGDWLPGSAESVHALHTLEQMDRAGVVQTVRVNVALPIDSIYQYHAGWNTLDRLSKRLASDPRSARVISITTIADSNLSSLSGLARETRRTFLSSDGHAALLEVLPAASVSLRDQVDWVRELRKTGAPALTGVPGATLLVGGIPALNADYQTIVADRFASVTALVVGGTLLALLCGFRALFAAVKAIALNQLSVAASFGALVLVFQDGHGSRLLGVPEGDGERLPLLSPSSPLPSSSDSACGLRSVPVLCAGPRPARRNGLE